jgi:histidine phosphotransferase ChpT
MSDRMTAPLTIGALDLAALLCSRLCHDLISPVGAIINGLEVMEEDKDEETKTFALDLIKKSATQASAKLQFCRLAFGAAGSAGAQIELGDAEKAARGLLEDGKTTLVWNLPRALVAKNRAKLLLNMLLVAGGTIPRGGTLTAEPMSEGYQVRARGLNAGLYGHFGSRLRTCDYGQNRSRYGGCNRLLTKHRAFRGVLAYCATEIKRFARRLPGPLKAH